ncbi:MAG: ornithine cyclodeaminase family protein [Chloroflexi bacterium]|nr:ornithine cyclodeaminase family protein [Chloroflexota bacterium]
MSGLRILRAADVERACPLDVAVEAVRKGFAALSGGAATIPVRPSIPLGGGGTALTMPAAVAGWPYWSVKVVTVAPGNTLLGLPLIGAAVLLGDFATGTPLALIEGASLTALRTGAAGGVAAAALARPASSILALFGAGAQARMQLRAAARVLKLTEVRVVSRDAAHSRAFVAEAAADPDLRSAGVRVAGRDDAVRGADIVVTATTSDTPVFDGALLGSGVHVTAVGSFRPSMRELDEATLRGARVVVDQRDAALAEAGELQGLRREDLVEIGDVVAGRAPGRTDARQRTVFKSVGNAVQDLAVAWQVYERAAEQGLGETIAWP